MMSTCCSKHVEAWNKYIKKEYVKLVINQNNEPHLMKAKSVHWTDDLHNIRRVGQADWSATCSHPELSVPVMKDRNG
jgi:hypothetical protein